MLNLPENIAVIEINSNHTISMWTRNQKDLDVFFGLLPTPTIEFSDYNYLLDSNQEGYWVVSAQLFTEYQPDNLCFHPALSTVILGEKLEAIINSARYSRNCLAYPEWCSLESKFKLFT